MAIVPKTDIIIDEEKTRPGAGGSGSSILARYYPLYVYDNNTNAPIEGALVRWTDRTGTLTDTGNTSTASDGCTSKTIVVRGDDVAPVSISVNVTKDGYGSNSIEVVGEDNPNNYTSISLAPYTTRYSYSCTVVDTSNNPITNATVNVYKNNSLLQTGTTGFNGFYGFLSSTNVNDISFQVSKENYITSRKEPILPDSPQIITLSVVPIKTYYYSVGVQDNNGSPVSGAKIKLYKTDRTTPFSLESITIHNDADVDQVVDEIYSTIADGLVNNIGIGEENVEYEYNFVDINEQSVADGFLNYVFNRLGLINPTYDNEILRLGTEYEIESETSYEYECPFCGEVTTGTGPEPTECPLCTMPVDPSYIQYQEQYTIIQIDDVEALINYIITHYDGSDIPKTVYDVNGLIFISSRSSSLPASIYVKGYKLDEEYSWSTGSGTCYRSESKFGNPLTLYAVHNESSDQYYYRFGVYDKNSQKPIEGVLVELTDGEDTLVETTDENGFIPSVVSSNGSMTINFSKEGYRNISNIAYPGQPDDTNYYSVEMSPKNEVYVVYADTDVRVSGVLVEIGSYTSSKKWILKKSYYTNENGYIDTLPLSYYSTTDKHYVRIKHYGVEVPLVMGVMPIEISNKSGEEDSDYEEINKFEQFNELSVNRIKELVATGNKELENGKISERVSYDNDDTFRINILDPDSINVYDIFTSIPVMMYDDTKSVIGAADISLKSNINDLRLKMINRYSGYYNPIFKDILFYNNFNADPEASDDNECLYSNTSFDSNYKDNYGSFGVINNLWFHKVNDNKNMEIIKTLTPYYPLTGQYALDCRDYNIFSSNWDVQYYTRQKDINTSEVCENISSMKNNPCMFGSKYLNVPETIEINDFSLGDDENWRGEWNDDWISNPDGCPGEVMYKEINNNSVNYYFFFRKRILRYFRDKLRAEFKKYINPEYSFGKNDLDDDIDEYVIKNILKLYELDSVKLFVRRTKMGCHNSKIENEYVAYLNKDVVYYRSHNFADVNTLTMTKMNRDDFDRKIVYNLRSGIKEDFGLTFKLKKI